MATASSFFRSDVVSTGDVFSTTGYPVIDRKRGGSIQGIVDALNVLLYRITVSGPKEEGGTLIVPGHGRLPDKGDFASVPLNPEGRRIASMWDPAKDKADGNECRSYGAAGLMRVPGRLPISWENDDTLRSFAAGGRFNPPNEFGALYTSLDANTAAQEVARGLRQRGIDPAEFPEGTWWVYELEVKLESVLDLTDENILEKSGISASSLTGSDVNVARRIAAEARERGYEALLVPSAAAPGSKNLVIFLDRAPARPIVIRSKPIVPGEKNFLSSAALDEMCSTRKGMAEATWMVVCGLARLSMPSGRVASRIYYGEDG